MVNAWFEHVGALEDCEYLGCHSAVICTRSTASRLQTVPGRREFKRLIQREPLAELACHRPKGEEIPHLQSWRRVEASSRDRFREGCIVVFVLVGVGGSEICDGPVQSIAASDVGSYRNSIA